MKHSKKIRDKKIEKINICSNIINYAKFKTENYNKIAFEIIRQMEFLTQQLKEELERYKPKEGYKFCLSCGREYPNTIEYFFYTTRTILEEDEEGYPRVVEKQKNPGDYCINCKKLFNRINTKHRNTTNLYVSGLFEYVLGGFRFLKETKTMEKKRERIIENLIKFIDKIKIFAQEIDEINNKIMEKIKLEEEEKEFYNKASYKTKDKYFIDEEDEYA